MSHSFCINTTHLHLYPSSSLPLDTKKSSLLFEAKSCQTFSEYRSASQGPAALATHSSFSFMFSFSLSELETHFFSSGIRKTTSIAEPLTALEGLHISYYVLSLNISSPYSYFSSYKISSFKSAESKFIF